MDEPPQHPATATALSSWERWVDSSFAWVPYVTLAISLVLSQFGSHEASHRVTVIGLTMAAAAWTMLTFTRYGSATRTRQSSLRLYYVGFVVLAGLLVWNEQVFLVYAITGFFHGSLLRPWSMAFVAIGAAGLLVHLHIVRTESTLTTWAIYVGVVAIQTAAVSFGLYGGQKISEIAEERRRTLERLELAMNENEGLHAQLVAQAREAGILDERQRLAREIHDTIAQGLAGIITQLEAAAHRSWDDEDGIRRHLGSATVLARESLDEARRSVRAIRPSQLVNSRLPDALSDVGERWSEISGVPVRVETTGDRRPLRPEVELILLRAAQEALANIAKHAGATRAGITLTFMDGSVTLDVRDDGIGFDPASTPKAQSFGLAAMRQRVEHVHGVLEVESTIGEGTAISVHIPSGALSRG
jgi:signal transduction histidine kinase